MEISKEDWKHYREKLPAWQENYMNYLNKEYMSLLSADKKSSEKFWELEKRIKDDRHHLGVTIEVRTSSAISDIIRLIRLDVIAYDDLANFSDELQQTVKMLLDRDLN